MGETEAMLRLGGAIAGLKAQATKVYEWPREVLSSESSAPGFPSTTGSTWHLSAAPQNTRNSSVLGLRPGIPASTPENTRPAFGSVGGSNRTVSSPNTPQFMGQPKLSSNVSSNTRARSNSVQHARSASTPVATTSSTNVLLPAVTPKKYTNLLPEVPVGQGSAVRSFTLHSQAAAANDVTLVQESIPVVGVQDTDRNQGQTTPWRPSTSTPLPRPEPLSVRKAPLRSLLRSDSC